MASNLKISRLRAGSTLGTAVAAAVLTLLVAGPASATVVPEDPGPVFYSAGGKSFQSFGIGAGLGSGFSSGSFSNQGGEDPNNFLNDPPPQGGGGGPTIQSLALVVQEQSVPEPATLGLLGLGVAAIGMMRLRRRR